MCSTSGGAAKYCPTSPRHAAKVFRAAEIDGVVFQRFPFHHQPITLRLLDRAMQLKPLKPLAAERRTALATAASKSFSEGLDVDLCDFGDHLGCAF